MLTDTKVENVYEDFYKDKQLIDFSSYPEDSKYYDDANNLVVGKMKDETYGKNHNILTYPFLFIIRLFECYYTNCQETALN